MSSPEYVNMITTKIIISKLDTMIGINLKEEAEPQNLNYMMSYFYVDSTVHIRISKREMAPPAAAIMGMNLGIANTKTIHSVAIPTATQIE